MEKMDILIRKQQTQIDEMFSFARQQRDVYY